MRITRTTTITENRNQVRYPEWYNQTDQNNENKTMEQWIMREATKFYSNQL
jgi:hypothetical protein